MSGPREEGVRVLSSAHDGECRGTKIVVLCGGRSAEHEISFLSAAYVVNTLRVAGFDVAVLGIERTGATMEPVRVRQALLQSESVPPEVEFPGADHWITYLLGLSPAEAVVFPVLHGPYGEDGTVQGVLEILGLPYVGAGVGASAVGMNKLYCKGILQSAGLPVLPWLACRREDWRVKAAGFAAAVEQRFGFPVFVKPANLGSSVGVSRCTSFDEIDRAVRQAFEYDEWILAEPGLTAREIEVSVLGGASPRVSVPGEIVPGDVFYSYEAKYLRNDSKLLIPAPLETGQTAEIRRLAGEVFQVLQLDGMARIDFLLDRQENRIWINEPNTIPGFTKISMFPKLWEASGLGGVELVKELIRLARYRRRSRNQLRCSR